MGRQMTRDGLEHGMGIELKNTVYREGEGIPVVLVHGFPVAKARFRVTKPAEARTRMARSRMPLIAWRTHTWT